MYCNYCGAQLAGAGQFCTACGKSAPPVPALHAVPVTGPAPMAALPSDRVRRHIPLLAALWCINGILRLLEVCTFTFIGHAILPGIFGPRHFGDFGPFRFFPFSFGMGWIAVTLAVFGLLHLTLAWGLYERKTWARPLGLVIGFLALLRFPLGTALGIYTIWVLLPEPSAREYQQIARA